MSHTAVYGDQEWQIKFKIFPVRQSSIRTAEGTGALSLWTNQSPMRCFSRRSYRTSPRRLPRTAEAVNKPRFAVLVGRTFSMSKTMSETFIVFPRSIFSVLNSKSTHILISVECFLSKRKFQHDVGRNFTQSETGLHAHKLF